MRKNIHRKVTEYHGWLAERRADPWAFSADTDDYRDLREEHYPQMLEVISLSDVARGVEENQRTGYTINAIEMRLKLMMRGWDASQYSDIRRNYLSLDLFGQNVSRRYLAQVNNSGLQLGSGTVTGTEDGVNLGGDVEAIVENESARNITCTAANGGIQIVDADSGTQPRYVGSMETGSSSFYASKNELLAQKPISQYRVMVLKHWDIVMDSLLTSEDIIKYFFDNPINFEDVYGPVRIQKSNPDNEDPNEYANITTRPGVVNVKAIPPTAPLLDKVFRQVDILYDKIVSLDPDKPYFSLDEVWKLNETIRWLDDEHYAIENNIFLVIYDIPVSKFNPRTWTSNGLFNQQDIFSYRPQANICYMHVTGELYYTQLVN